MTDNQLLLERLEGIEQQFEDVNAQLADPNIITDIEKVKTLSKAFKELNRIMEAYKQYRSVNRSIEGAKDIIEGDSDEEMRELAKEELNSLMPRKEQLEQQLKDLLVPKDPDDEKNAILEIRAGTGGDEASLFAGDLFRMYQRFCEKHGFGFEISDYSEGTVGGFKEVIVNIRGSGAYGAFKFESGVHRVQRVPDTETQGRVHTSAATVAVLPEPEEFDVQLNEADIKKETFCSQGAGGQSVNTTYSAVRLTHIPTGVVVSMQNERSQIKNYELALKILKARLYEIELNKRNAEAAAMRKSLVSTGDRSAKIRTYNYPQSRITDHRIDFTLYNLPAVLDGDLDKLIEALSIAENANKMDSVNA